MENKFKVGDVLQYKDLIVEVLEVSPYGFTNMYILRRYGSNSGATSFKNFDVVHKNCKIATPASTVLFKRS